MWTITAYCICVLCCGHTHGITKSGRQATPGHTVACPPQMLHLPVVIDGVGIRVCDDTGSKIKGNRIDLFMDSHEAADAFGTRKREVVWMR